MYPLQSLSKILNKDVHDCKWALVISGIKGSAGESVCDTKQSCIKFAKEHLKVVDAETTQMATCHRLNQQADAAICIYFVELDQRNKWLMGARNIKGMRKKYLCHQTFRQS